MKSPLFPICLLLAGAGVSALHAADVVSWRKDGNGLYPDARPVTDWEDADGLAWQTPLPERGNGSPILVDGKIFLTAEPARLLCVDAATGKLLWEKANDPLDLVELDPEEMAELEASREKSREIAERSGPLERELYREQRRMRRGGGTPEQRAKVEALTKELEELRKAAGPLAEQFKKPPAHDTNGYASYTPVSDGKHVWACFGTGVVVCYDLDGKRIWHTRTQAPDHEWGGACSPTLVGGRLIVRFSDYIALDPGTGDEVWRAASGGVVFNCPANFELEGKHFIYTARGELFRAEDGKKLPSQDFTGTAKPWCFFNTPSVIGKRVYCAYGSEGEQGEAHALEIPETVEALEKDGLKVVWHKQVNKNRYYSSPLVHEGIVYLITREYQMQALDAESGEELYSQRVRGFSGTAYPSLTLAGDLIFVGAEDGNAAFVKPGREFHEASRTKVEPYRSTPIHDGGWTFLRTQESLMAFRAE